MKYWNVCLNITVPQHQIHQGTCSQFYIKEPVKLYIKFSVEITIKTKTKWYITWVLLVAWEEASRTTSVARTTSSNKIWILHNHHNPKYLIKTILTHFWLMFSFYTIRKHQKTMVYKMGTLARNRLKIINSDPLINWPHEKPIKLIH